MPGASGHRPAARRGRGGRASATIELAALPQRAACSRPARRERTLRIVMIGLFDEATRDYAPGAPGAPRARASWIEPTSCWRLSKDRRPSAAPSPMPTSC